MKTKNNFAKKAKVIAGAMLLMANVCSYAQTEQIADPLAFTQWVATGLGNQYASDVAVDGNGDSYTVGFYTSGTINSPGWSPLSNYGPVNTEDGYIIKYSRGDDDQYGNQAPSNWALWAVRVGGAGADRCQSVTTLGDGAGGYYIYVVGWYTTTATFESHDGLNQTLSTVSGGTNAYLARYDQDLNLHYVYDIGGTSPGTDYAYQVTAAFDVTGDRGIYIGGRNGSQLGFVCRGGTSATVSPVYSDGGDEGYVVRYNDLSNYAIPAWIRYMTSTGSDAVYAVEADENGVSFGGQFKGEFHVQQTATTYQTFGLSGSSDAFMGNYNRFGNYVWCRRLGGNSTGSTPENTTCITLDIDGNTYAGGMFANSAPGFTCANASGLMECFVEKYSPTGTILWSKCGGSTGSFAGNDYVTGVVVDRCTKHVYVAGLSHGATFNFGTMSLPAFGTGSNDDNFFLQLDAVTGNYLTGTGKVFGSHGNDISYGLCIDRLNYVYMVGITSGATWTLPPHAALSNTASGSYDGFLWRFNEAHWPALASPGTTNPFAGAPSAQHVDIDVDNCNIYCTGIFDGTLTYAGITKTSTSGGNFPSIDACLTRSDKFGNYTGFTMLATGSSHEVLMDQAMDASGIYAVGYAMGEGVTDVYGNPFTTVSGSTTTIMYGDVYYAPFIKTDMNGAILWSLLAKPNNTSSLVLATGVTVDKFHGCIYVYGNFSGSVSFPTTTGPAVTLNGNTTNQLFVAKYNTAGVLSWVKTVAFCTSGLSAAGISVEETSGDFYLTGSINGTAFFNGNMTSTPLTSAGINNLFIARYNSSGFVTRVTKHAVAGSFGGKIVSPNGMNGEVYVCGIVNGQALVAKCILPTVGTISWPWVTTGSLGGTADLCLGSDGTSLYVTGGINSGYNFTLGAQSYANPTGINRGLYMASIARSTGNVTCLGIRNPAGMLASTGIAQDNYTGNVYVSGGSGVNFEFSGAIHEFSPDYCNYSNRLAAPSQGNTNAEAETPAKPAVAITTNLFPNPSDGVMTLQISGANVSELPATLILIDLSGRVVMQKDNIITDQNSVDGSELAEGVYIYQVTRNNVVIGNGRIVITR